MVFTGSLWSSRPTVGSPNAPARQEKSEPAPPSKRNGFQLFLSSVWGGVVSNVFLLLFPSFSFPGSVCSVLLPLCLLCSKTSGREAKQTRKKSNIPNRFRCELSRGGSFTMFSFLLFSALSFPGSVCSVLLPLGLLCSKTSEGEEKQTRKTRDVSMGLPTTPARQEKSEQAPRVNGMVFDWSCRPPVGSPTTPARQEKSEQVPPE